MRLSELYAGLDDEKIKVDERFKKIKEDVLAKESIHHLQEQLEALQDIASLQLSLCSSIAHIQATLAPIHAQIIQTSQEILSLINSPRYCP